ncbi:MAG TPA: Imm21 family immunity protein [Streptomyces sp.]|nr:Imm21 family immunity protein [Streptomyces sp.]
MVRYAEPGTVQWVDSGGGPLVAVPETVLPFWAGADGEETASDYDRACEAGHLGLLPVGDCAALVLGDEAASTAFLPDRGLFVRRPAATAGPDALAGVPAALRTAQWSPDVRWNVHGPVWLFDAAQPGGTGRVRLALDPGRYAVRAARVPTGPETWVGLVQLRRLD